MIGDLVERVYKKYYIKIVLNGYVIKYLIIIKPPIESSLKFNIHSIWILMISFLGTL